MMIPRSHPFLLIVFIIVIAPLTAAVFVAALLLFGIQPHSVFAPGWAVKSFLQSLGLSAPNAVGVIVTVGMWWGLFVSAGLLWEWRSGRKVG